MQMVSSRSAQESVSATRLIAMVRATRRAVVSGTMPMPTWHSTSRHTESKLRSCTRSARPLRAATDRLADLLAPANFSKLADRTNHEHRSFSCAHHASLALQPLGDLASVALVT